MKSQPVLRIFSYLPNPRVWKALIAAEYCDVLVEVMGDKPPNLQNWLWDFDARELAKAERTPDHPSARVGRRGFRGTLYKTDAFLEAHPFGTVPAAFDPDGFTGIFESNSILRAVARRGDATCKLYGEGDYGASRIDSFLDAALVFTRESQVYMLGMSEPSVETYDRMAAAYEFYLNGINQALTNNIYIASDALSIVDIAFACDLAQFLRENTMKEQLMTIDRAPISTHVKRDYPHAYEHLVRLSNTPEFNKHLAPLVKDLVA